jgi:hypothetical protein
MVSIHIVMKHRPECQCNKQTQEEVIYKDEHINTDTNLKLTRCEMNQVCIRNPIDSRVKNEQEVKVEG